jgi:hypothetical protein
MIPFKYNCTGRRDGLSLLPDIKKGVEKLRATTKLKMSKPQNTPRLEIESAVESSVSFTIAVTEASDNPHYWMAKK